MTFAENIGPGAVIESGLLAALARYIGTTVTVYMTSGGQSGFGVTGVLASVNPGFIRLLTCIGPAPCCPLGSTCTGGRIGMVGPEMIEPGVPGGPFISNVGSVIEIPINRIAAYVHNAI
jgi:hypothetical protein